MSNTEQVVKPPLGLTPRHVVARHRIEAIDEAIKRFDNAYRLVPAEWIEEKLELELYLVRRTIS